jgi:hypothetical protein
MPEGEDPAGQIPPANFMRKAAGAVAVAAHDDSANVYIPNIPKSATTMTMLTNAVRGACRHHALRIVFARLCIQTSPIVLCSFQESCAE